MLIRSCLGAGTSGGGEDIDKWCRRVDLVEILCSPVSKWKNETYWNHSKNGKGR
jgi:hypothetical protein